VSTKKQQKKTDAKGRRLAHYKETQVDGEKGRSILKPDGVSERRVVIVLHQAGELFQKTKKGSFIVAAEPVN